MKNIASLLVAVLFLACCTQQKKSGPGMSIDPAKYDTIIDGKQVSLYTLQNDSGVIVHISNYGARIISVYAPDKVGNYDDIAIGYGSIAEYTKDLFYLGCIVGRYANRIKDARFSINGEEFNLFKNDGDNTLHGGRKGFDKRVWDAKQEGNKIVMTYFSADGEEGYPGNLTVSVSYTLNPDNSLIIEYEADTDKPTHVNLSNHAYWNLKGDGDPTVLDHYYMINADSFTLIDKEWIPTGVNAPVENTPFDFRTGKKIGQDITAEHEQLTNGLGYDHNWVLNKDSGDSISLAAKLWEETTGRYIKFYTTEPGLQFYSGNFLDSTTVGKTGKVHKYRSAVAIETQHFPDSPNQPNFPSTLLLPGEKYTQITIVEFGVEE